jgi:hypothetical protein
MSRGLGMTVRHGVRTRRGATTMNVQRFASLVCSLSSTPSRRAVNHALLGLAAGSFLAP